jgi:thiol-disulfide isomerase/thioredoxin
MTTRMQGPRAAASFGCVVFVTACWFASACDEGGDVQHITRPTTTPQLPAARAPALPAPIEGVQRIDASGLRERILAHGRGTVVNVWASWCGSCRDEVPMLLKLREAFAAEGVDFLFVSADEPEEWPKALKLMQDWGGPLPIFAVAGSMTPFKRALHPSWQGAIPATFLFDATFKRRYFWEGPVYDHEIAPIVQGFLAGDAIDGETRPALRGGPGN